MNRASPVWVMVLTWLFGNVGFDREYRRAKEK